MRADGVIDTLKLFELLSRKAKRHPDGDGSTEYLGDLDVDVGSTDQPQPMVWVAGTYLLLGRNNVVLVDRFDGVGGPPRFELLRLDDPVFDVSPTKDSIAARLPRIREFLRE